MRRRATKKTHAPDGKTVGVPMTAADIAALRAYQDAVGRAEYVAPRDGPSVLALFRRGVAAWQAERAAS